MDNLWAPWRSQYISEKPKNEECVFCAKIEQNTKEDAQNLLLLRGKTCFVSLNIFPYNNGHLLVLPNRHVGSIEELAQAEFEEFCQLTREMVALLKQEFNPGGFNIGINMGAAAGAGIPGHLHLHIVPRWQGDTNFMPVTGKIKVIPERLEDTYRKLKHRLAKKHLTEQKGGEEVNE